MTPWHSTSNALPVSSVVCSGINFNIMTDATAADILLAFGKECLTRPAVIDQLLGLAKKYSITINSLHSSWLMLNKENTGNSLMPTLEQLDDLDDMIAK